MILFYFPIKRGEFTMLSSRFLFFTKTTKPDEFTRCSRGFYQVVYFSQNSTKPSEFTRHSPGFFFSQNSTKPGEFSRLSPSFFFTKFHKTWWIHQVFTRCSPGFFYFAQNSTKPGEFTRFSPGFLIFKKFHKTWWPGFFNFHKMSQNQVCTRFSPDFLFFT